MSESTFVEVMRPKLLANHRITESGCWEWIAGRSTFGYGITNYQRKQMKAHRASYLVFCGDVPEGLELDHLCRNRACINPAHLECVTSRENTLRGIGPAAMHAAKTHCLHGHEFSPENTRIDSKGHRICRACHRERQAVVRMARKEAA